MALIDANPQFVVQACKKIRSYLEDIRTSIENHPEGPVVNFDFDAIGQLLTPHSRKSGYSGLLWHSVFNAKELGDLSNGFMPSEGSFDSGERPTRRVQIPEGAKQELRYFCRKLLRDYINLVQGASAQKFGIEPDDWERLLSDEKLSDDDLGRLVRKVGAINLSLSLLAKLLDSYAEFSRLTPPSRDDVRFQDYLMRIETQRPQADRAINNSNDALNLAQTSDLRSQGYDAYLVTTTRAVRDSENRYTKEPFYFGLELAVRKSLKNLSRDAASNRLSVLISRLTQVIVHTQQFGDLVSASSKAHRTDLDKEIELVRKALSGLGSDPVLKEITALLSDTASALRSAYTGPADSANPADSLPGDVALFAKFRSIVSRLRSNLGDVPHLRLQRKKLSSDHLSYSLLDQEGNLLFAADLYSDDLAIAWATEITIEEFCDRVAEYYTKLSVPKTLSALMRLAGVKRPQVFEISALGSVRQLVLSQAGDCKISLLKVVCDDNLFWYDASALYAFDEPEETRQVEDARVAVSIGHKDQLTELTEFFLATTTSICSKTEAHSNLKKLFSMEE